MRMDIVSAIKKDLRKSASKEKATVLSRFFKTGRGEYGEGDRFLGVVVPAQRMIAKKYSDKMGLINIASLLKSAYHEERMTALLILMIMYKKSDDAKKEKIFRFYLKNIRYVNNWDLVDVTCRDIIGAHLFRKDRKILYKLAKSGGLWERRVAVVSTWYFISKGDLSDTFKIVEMLLDDRRDLTHKAAGWMLREAGKRNRENLEDFLAGHVKKMPRTMLRYAIEKFSPRERAAYLKK